MLSKKLLDEFKIITKEEYGIDLSDQETAQITTGLVGYFDLLAKIHHRETLVVEDPDLLQEKE